MAPPRRAYPTSTPGRIRNRQTLIPQRDEPSPFQRDAAAVQRQDEEAWPWDETNVVPEYPLPDPPRPEQNTVQVEFEEDNYGTRAVTRPAGYWKLRNGKFILITEMSDSHLTNTIHMLERNAQSRGRRITRTGSYGELMAERERRHRYLQRQAEDQRRVSEMQQMQQFLRSQPPGAEATLNALVGRAAAYAGLERIPSTSSYQLQSPISLEQANLDVGNLTQGLSVSYVHLHDSIEVRVPEPEPQPSPSAIEENRPTRRIKT